MTEKSKKTDKKAAAKEEQLTDEELKDVQGGASLSIQDASKRLSIGETLFGGDIGDTNFDTLFAGASIDQLDPKFSIKGSDQLKR